jgi:predicted amidohydrolase
MEDLKIAYIQTTLHWQNVALNLSHFSRKLDEIKEQVDVLILPEMFTTGFTMKTSGLAEQKDGKAIKWMQEIARDKNAIVAGSLIFQEGKLFYNRLIWMQPDGNYKTYDKRHLFRMAGEQNEYASGNKRLLVNIKGWNICPLICYDLRFPVWSRNKMHNEKYEYDVLIYVANWPERRAFAWKSLLIARAIENQCYLIGVNRVGEDGNEINYSGDSVALDYLGNKISQMEGNAESTEIVTLNYSKLAQYRNQFPAGLDADHFEIL